MRPRIWPTIAAALALARVACGADAADATLATTQALMGRGEYRQALVLLEPRARPPALTTLQRARLYQQLSAARSQVGTEDQPLADADPAEREARAIDAFDLLARIESVRGVVWLNRGRSVESLRDFKDCLARAERSATPALVAGAYITSSAGLPRSRWRCVRPEDWRACRSARPRPRSSDGWLAGWTTAVSLLGMGVALGMAVAAGLAFGIYPALVASRWTPAEALRAEV
ncbi:MAG TPA: ABC transporter permease [Vicinamibacterales bacterium]